jgi:hypothetical protein
MLRWSCALMALALTACGQPPNTVRAPARADKARIFGDASLVPTREGERIRREIALAGEIEALIEPLPEVTTAGSSVDLRPPTARVLVSVLTPEVTEDETRQLEHYAREVAAAVVGREAEISVALRSGPAPEPARSPAFPVLLALALVGMGSSAGIAFERLRRRRGA